MSKSGNGEILESVREVRNLVGEHGVYRGIVDKESVEYNDFEKIYGCVRKLQDVVGRGRELQRSTRVTDGYLIPILNGEWCRLLDEVQGFMGYVIYRGKTAVRVTVVSGQDDSIVQELQVGVIRGSEGVIKRLENLDIIIEEVHV